MDRVLLLVCLCLKYAMFAEVKDNETLIYHWDVHHKIYYYCQFGTKEQVYQNFEQQCFKRNKNMQHILPDGTITFPYIAYGSRVGLILKCRNILHAELHGCSRLLYKTCRYTCRDSSITRDMTCELRGPWDNVTAQWSVAEPCSDILSHLMQPVTQTTLMPGNSRAEFNSTSKITVLTAVTKSSSSSEFQTSPVVDTNTILVVTMPKSSYTTVLASTIPTAVVLIVVAILVFVLYKYLRKRRKKSWKAHTKVMSTVAESIAFYPALDRECNQPLVISEGEDNLQKISSDSDTNTSNASSEAIHDAADENEEENDDTRVADTMMNFGSMGPQDNDDTRIAEALINFESMGSRFSSWEKMKQLIEDDKVTVPESPPAPSQPERCSASVSQLLEQPGTYHRNLRAQLEVISTRTREQALIGYMEQHMTLYGYQSRNELKVLEQTFHRQVDEKVSDVFLRVLAGYGVRIGYLVEYFYQHRNWDAICVILQVHKGCPYCETYRRQCELFVSG